MKIQSGAAMQNADWNRKVSVYVCMYLFKTGLHQCRGCRSSGDGGDNSRKYLLLDHNSAIAFISAGAAWLVMSKKINRNENVCKVGKKLQSE